MRFLIILLLVLSVNNANAQDRPANWLTVIDAGLAGADIGQSMDAFSKGIYYEANPILRPLTDNPAWFGFAKASLTAGTLVLIHKYTKPRSKLRYVALISYGVLEGVVITLNQHTLSHGK